MKALSIRQPWAWLICAGHQDIENRDWQIEKSLLPMRIYVHTGKHRGSDWPLVNHVWIPARLPLGVIIGEVTITDCVTTSKSKWFVGRYGFVLVEPKLYETPIPCKGQLGFFEVMI